MISGLQINYGKSTYIPINIEPQQLVITDAILRCQRAEFPMQYLGMPLTLKRPTRQQFLPLVENIETKLGGWKGKIISRGGRLQLVNSVLSSIPIYYMASFRLPRWVINRIDKIRRQFLWGKADGSSAGISLMNWGSVCLPKLWGGLGLPDLEMRNISLLIRWWWKAYHEPNSLWTSIIKLIRWKGGPTEGPNIWMITGSFFWRQLQMIKRVFHWSCTWAVGDGMRIAFWFDPWGERPLADQLQAHGTLQCPNISLRDAWPRLEMLIPDTARETSLTFRDIPDELLWRWEGKGVYSAKSLYNVMMGGGKIKWHFRICWLCKVPPTVKVFANLLMHGKILTHDVMLKRGMTCAMDCVLCDQCPTKSALHLLFLCPYANSVWMRVAHRFACQVMRPGMSVQEVWCNSWEWVRCQGLMDIKGWSAIFLCVCWHLWKQRNVVVFGERRLDPKILANRTTVEAALWSKYC